MGRIYVEGELVAESPITASPRSGALFIGGLDGAVYLAQAPADFTPAPFIPPGPNIALDKPYTMEPLPTYGDCADAGDAPPRYRRTADPVRLPPPGAPSNRTPCTS